MWECGLKHKLSALHFHCGLVTPHVGVWIETRLAGAVFSNLKVTPHVGVWIETNKCPGARPPLLSLPMWECGLKPPPENALAIPPGHSPCGSVD